MRGRHRLSRESQDAFEQARAILSHGDVLGAERKFVDIADSIVREKADAGEARAIFEAGKLAEQRIDWRAASAHYARAARLEPSNLEYVTNAGWLAERMGDYAAAASFNEARLSLATCEFGLESPERAKALTGLADTYLAVARYKDAEQLYRRAIEIMERTLGKEHPEVAGRYNNLANLLRAQAKNAEAERLYARGFIFPAHLDDPSRWGLLARGREGMSCTSVESSARNGFGAPGDWDAPIEGIAVSTGGRDGMSCT